ncbi:MAG: hypothetical protein B9S33_00665 [Pedosphaera sp. Tous-C6FEB]|nr:MAG: hypothetical protein B9S33_00665 [Pedosphaera sp. Tous-C6FEB]
MKRWYECGSADHALSRRQMLGSLAGTAAVGACGLSSLMQQAVAAEMKKQNRQVIFIWLDGGISQFESWDPKPDSEFGGPFRSIPTSVPGVHVSELMPHTAKLMHHLTVVRSMSTKDPNHSTGVARIQRGDPANRGVNYPFLGAAVTKLLGAPANGLPPYIWIKPGSGGFIYQEAGFLGAKYGALALGEGKPPIHIQRPDSISDADDAARNELRRLANARFRLDRRESEVDAYEQSYDMAMQLMKRKELFDNSRLPAKDIARYGTHPLGRHLLQARVLLEAGVQFIKVTSYHWDTHGDNFNMSQQLVPQIDQPFAALIQDLADRSMLDNVLVVLMSEFGRTPTINSRLGRDHWPDAWSLALAGAGIRRGNIVGQTTKNGAWVEGEGYDVGHLFHTLFSALGINSKKIEYKNNGQPLPIARDDYEPIKLALA